MRTSNQLRESEVAQDITFVSEVDFERILQIIENLPGNVLPPPHLEEKIKNMEVIEPAAVPNDLVTMNSEVKCTVEARSGAVALPDQLKLVYPKDLNQEEGRVCILTPIGTALLGAKVGTPITWRRQDGSTRTLHIKEIIYQPEANGDWHL